MTAVSAASSGLPEQRRLRTDVLLMAATKFLVLVLGVITSVILARGLGASGRGTLAVAFNMTLLLVQFGTFGLVTANPYFVSRRPEDVGHLVLHALVLAAALGGALFGVGLGIRAVWPDLIAGVTWQQAAIAFAAIPLTLTALFLQSILLGLGRTIAYNAIEAATGVLGAAGLAVGFAFLDLDIAGALAVLGLQQLAAALLYLIFLRAHLSGWSGLRPALVSAMVRYGAKIYVATLLGFMVIRIDVFMVNAKLGADQAGLYAVAAALADGMALLPAAVALNLFARIARGSDTQVSVEVFRSVAVLFAVLCLLTVPVAQVAISVMFGEGFSGASTLYFWLLPGIWSLGMLTILAHHFAGRGFPIEAMLVWFVGIALNVAINLAFLHHGAWVASMSSSVAYGVLLMLHVRMLARETGYAALRPRPLEAFRMLRVALSRTPAA